MVKSILKNGIFSITMFASLTAFACTGTLFESTTCVGQDQPDGGCNAIYVCPNGVNENRDGTVSCRQDVCMQCVQGDPVGTTGPGEPEEYACQNPPT